MEENRSKELTLKVEDNFYVAMHESSYINTVQNDPWTKKLWRSLGLMKG